MGGYHKYKNICPGNDFNGDHPLVTECTNESSKHKYELETEFDAYIKANGIKWRCAECELLRKKHFKISRRLVVAEATANGGISFSEGMLAVSGLLLGIFVLRRCFQKRKPAPLEYDIESQAWIESKQ